MLIVCGHLVQSVICFHLDRHCTCWYVPFEDYLRGFLAGDICTCFNIMPAIISDISNKHVSYYFALNNFFVLQRISSCIYCWFCLLIKACGSVSDDGEVTAVQVKKKKPLKERIAEKAEQRRKELEEKKQEVLRKEVLSECHFTVTWTLRYTT